MWCNIQILAQFYFFNISAVLIQIVCLYGTELLSWSCVVSEMSPIHMLDILVVCICKTLPRILCHVSMCRVHIRVVVSVQHS